MNQSKLTLLVFWDLLKTNATLLVVLPFFLALVVVLSLNVPIGGSNEKARVIRSWAAPSHYRLQSIAVFIELSNGTTTVVGLPSSSLPPSPGSEVTVLHSKRLLMGDSYTWIE